MVYHTRRATEARGAHPTLTPRPSPLSLALTLTLTLSLTLSLTLALAITPILPRREVGLMAANLAFLWATVSVH